MNECIRFSHPETRGQAENSFALSTASVLDKSTLVAALTWTVQNHVDVAIRSGYQGVELWPQGIRPLAQIHQNRLAAGEKTHVLSLHQGVGKDLRAVRSLQELQIALFLPQVNASLSYLEMAHRALGDIPVVLLSHTPEAYMEKSSFTRRGIQPNPEVCKEWGVQNAEQFVEAAAKRKFTGVVLDTHHIRRPHSQTGEPNPFADWQTSLPLLLEHTQELHIGIGRNNDWHTNEGQVREEALDLLTGGNKNTEIVQMLHMIAQTGWGGLIVIEMRPSVYRDIMGRKFFLSNTDLRGVYERVRNTLFHVLDA